MLYNVYWCDTEHLQFWQLGDEGFKECAEEHLYVLYSLVPNRVDWHKREESIWTDDETGRVYVVSIDHDNAEIYIEEY